MDFARHLSAQFVRGFGVPEENLAVNLLGIHSLVMLLLVVSLLVTHSLAVSHSVTHSLAVSPPLEVLGEVLDWASFWVSSVLTWWGFFVQK